MLELNVNSEKKSCHPNMLSKVVGDRPWPKMGLMAVTNFIIYKVVQTLILSITIFLRMFSDYCYLFIFEIE